ncbi:choice-of-anchor L domain-containing protein [Olleya sp. Bg11-27]|uniref:choice-of-anchor L domain-containing protein n=1 Tax=Olleya sp. Bg11-27 TaxID=2058135 RepID=UPI000C31A912|nr:choice-of-anchor L domain-containing protein [Olleya sp. Bg11-27]AUC74251.1 hypothetical protein CW732_00580 [Olleya sp. Bg11-27]
MKKHLLFVIFFFVLFTAHAQVVIMQNDTFNQSSGVFYDSGGESSNYSDGENFVVTICPDSADQFVQLDFSSFTTQLGVDVMTIYGGDDTSAPKIGAYSGRGAASNPGTISGALTSLTGCLTIAFVSDAIVNTTASGWRATISCIQYSPTITPTINLTNRVSDKIGIIEVALDSVVSFDGSTIFEDDDAKVMYSWGFGDSSGAVGKIVNHKYSNLGLFTVTCNALNANRSGFFDSSTMQVRVVSPYIEVDQTTYTVPELVEDVLINSACTTVSNINWSTGTNYGDVNGIGYFSAQPGDFAFEAGIVLSSGDAMEAEGPENGAQNSESNLWLGDSDLESAINTDLDSNPGDDLPAGFSTNASYIEFDFVPIANSISFDFLFASDEYGEFQCQYSDAFAFLLTDLTTTTTTNLALVPGTTDVVSVYTVRNAVFDPGCSSENPGYFDSYYGIGGQPVINAPIGFRGYTVAMTAFANVTPNNSYRIKLVVADDGGSTGGDTGVNSAVFLGAGTFNLGGDLGEDITIDAGTAICSGGIVTLDTNLPTATHTWYFDGAVIAGEEGATLDVTEQGVYTVNAVFSGTCQTSDSIFIEFRGPNVENTLDIIECDDSTGTVVFDLTMNTSEVTGTQGIANVSYHNLLVDAQNDLNPIADPANYLGSGIYPETIYVRIEDIGFGSQNCADTGSFILDISSPLINQAPDLKVCDDASNDGFELFDLESQTTIILGSQFPTNFIVTYHNSFLDADTGNNPLVSPYNGSNGEFVFVRLETRGNSSCYSVNQSGGFTLVVNPVAIALQPMNMQVCDDFTEDGFEIFDLTSQESPILGGQDPLGYTVAFYESMTDASMESNPILNPGAYQNAVTPQQTIYVRVNDNINTTCYGSTTFDLVVNSSPIIIDPSPLSVCDDGTPDGLTSIYLSLKNNEISGGNPAYAVTYYLTQLDADMAMNALPIPYYNISNPQTVFVRVEDVNTTCYTTTTLQLEVEQAPITFAPTDLVVCDPDSDGFSVFTLTDSEAQITGGVPGLSVTYHETVSDAQLNVNPLTSPYNNIVEDVQVVYVRVESATITTACASYEDLRLIVNPTPQITDPSPLEVCDNDTDGIALFDLELNNPEILNQLDTDTTNDLATADYTITFYTTAADAAVPQNAIATPNAFTNTTVNMQTIWVVITDNANGCSTTTPMDLIVNPLPVLVQPTPLELCNDTDLPGEVPALAQEAFTLEDANAQILNGQTGITLTYYFTQTGASNGSASDQIFSPYVNTANAQTVYVRAEDNVTGCISTITLNLRVNPIPSPEANPSTLIECDSDNDGFALFDLDSQTISILNGESGVSISYHETEADATSDINPLTSPYTNIVPSNQNVYVRAENDITGCFTIVILPLDVQPSPVVPITIDDYIVCDDNNDGFNQFDFDTVMTPQILGTQNPADFTLTYHTTALNAESGNSPIVNTSNYTNVTNPQTIYIRLVSNTNGCVTTGQFEIIVEFPPVLVQPTPLAICDELDANYYENNDDIATFDLTVKNDEIIAGNVSWIVAYYETQADAQADVNVIADPTQYTNMMVGTNPANPQTVYVRVTNSITGCFSFTTLTIRVLPNPTPLENPDNIELCDDVAVVGPNDLIELFDLTQDAAVILNGEGINPSDPRHLSYYTDLDNALMGTTPIADPTMHSNEDPTNPGVAITPQTIYVRVTNGTDEIGTSGTGCYTIVSFDIIVNPLPEVSPIEDYIYCELFSDGQYGFDLVSKTDEILGTQSATDFTLTFYAADGTTIGNPSNYTNATNPEIISVDITNNLTGCIARTSFTIEVQEGAQANPDMAPIVYELCDDTMETDGDTTNDSTQFDLVTQNPEVLDGQDPANYIVSYYATQADADAALNALPLLYENIINPQVIYVRVDNDTMIDDGSGTGTMVDTSICYETAELTLQVNPLPEVELESSYLLCINTNGTEVVSAPIIETGLNTTDYTFEWLLENITIPGESGNSLEPTQGGNYSVIVTDISSSSVTMCQTVATTIVEESEPPTIAVELLTEAFADVHNIYVTATGSGSSVYEFSIDDGPWEVNVPNDGTYTFTDVGAGDHIVTVRDINGCGEFSLPIPIMDYPHFFTPNDDGFNDTWNIYGIDDQPDAVIYIFDRYGKLLKQLSPTGLGWDGTYNGNPMPTSDYWFTVDYREPNDPNNAKKQFKAHFTLKR